MVSPVNRVAYAQPSLNTVAGLSEQDAIAKLGHDGYNELPSARSRSLWSIAWNTVQDPIFLLLVCGGSIYWLLGDLQESLILLGFVFFLTAISLLWFELLKQTITTRSW